ncbi:MAG: hypothetical protein JHC33_06730 [Ignisphaera sp.]|nr:hypothetical protein [Ignisphaera sp.]
MLLHLTHTFQIVSNGACLIESDGAFQFCFGSAFSDAVFTYSLGCDRMLTLDGSLGSVYTRLLPSASDGSVTLRVAL